MTKIQKHLREQHRGHGKYYYAFVVGGSFLQRGIIFSSKKRHPEELSFKTNNGDAEIFKRTDKFYSGIRIWEYSGTVVQNRAFDEALSKLAEK